MVKLHYSLVRQITIAGISEKACYMIWLSVMITCVGVGQWWIAPIGGIMHIICMIVSKIDDYFFEIVLKAIKFPDYLE